MKGETWLFWDGHDTDVLEGLLGRAQEMGIPPSKVSLVVPHGLHLPIPAGRIFCLHVGELTPASAATAGHVLASLMRRHRPETAIAPSDILSRTVFATAAALLGTGLTADCTELRIENGRFLQVRPALGGNLYAVIETPHTLPRMATVSTAKKNPHSIGESLHEPPVVHADPPPPPFEAPLLLERRPLPDAGKIPLHRARIVLAGGMGMKSAENFSFLFRIAALTGGAVGATRAAVEAGWASAAIQVGQTGTAVSPEIYIAFGISGAVQHMAGIHDARCIIAVNTDPNAPICKAADYIVQADAVEVASALLDRLESTD